MASDIENLSEVEKLLKSTLHKLDLKRIDLTIYRHQARDLHVSRLKTLQNLEDEWKSRGGLSPATKLLWKSRIEHDRAREDEIIEAHEMRLGKWLVLAEKLRGIMTMKDSEAWETELSKAMVEFTKACEAEDDWTG